MKITLARDVIELGMFKLRSRKNSHRPSDAFRNVLIFRGASSHNLLFSIGFVSESARKTNQISLIVPLLLNVCKSKSKGKQLLN